MRSVCIICIELLAVGIRLGFVDGCVWVCNFFFLSFFFQRTNVFMFVCMIKMSFTVKNFGIRILLYLRSLFILCFFLQIHIQWDGTFPLNCCTGTRFIWLFKWNLLALLLSTVCSGFFSGEIKCENAISFWLYVGRDHSISWQWYDSTYTVSLFSRWNDSDQ